MTRLTQQQAARTIQRAFRTFLARQQNKISIKYPQNNRNDLGNKTNNLKQFNDSKTRQATLNNKYISSAEIRSGNNEDYNFINVFKKRGCSHSTTGILGSQSQSRHKHCKLSSYYEKKSVAEVNVDDYSEDLTVATRKKEVIFLLKNQRTY